MYYKLAEPFVCQVCGYYLSCGGIPNARMLTDAVFYYGVLLNSVGHSFYSLYISCTVLFNPARKGLYN